MRGHDIAYVSRGGLKLEKAMQVFPLTPAGKVCMDIGASTGGFTDCMLQNGAQKVYAVDVGYGQLAWKLRCDERVVNMERTNIRHVTREMLQDDIQFFSVDVSFISLRHIFPVAKAVTASGAQECLPGKTANLKPAGKRWAKKAWCAGCQRRRQVLGAACGFARENGFACAGLDFSPIRRAGGEY